MDKISELKIGENFLYYSERKINFEQQYDKISSILGRNACPVILHRVAPLSKGRLLCIYTIPPGAARS
jgi:hypothetical protein